MTNTLVPRTVAWQWATMFCFSHAIFCGISKNSCSQHVPFLGIEHPGNCSRHHHSLWDICHLPPLTESEQIKFFFYCTFITNESLGGICCVNVCLRYFLRTQGPESKLQNEHKNHIKILRMVCRGCAPIRLSQFGPNSLSCPPDQG